MFFVQARESFCTFSVRLTAHRLKCNDMLNKFCRSKWKKITENSYHGTAEILFLFFSFIDLLLGKNTSPVWQVNESICDKEDFFFKSTNVSYNFQRHSDVVDVFIRQKAELIFISLQILITPVYYDYR